MSPLQPEKSKRTGNKFFQLFFHVTRPEFHFIKLKMSFSRMLCSYVICHIYVRYLTTRYMMMQVAAIPPNRMYLSPSDLRSINLMTVLLMPKTEATSRTFFWMPFSVTLCQSKKKMFKFLGNKCNGWDVLHERDH